MRLPDLVQIVVILILYGRIGLCSADEVYSSRDGSMEQIAGWSVGLQIVVDGQRQPLRAYCWCAGQDFRIVFVDDRDHLRAVLFRKGAILIDRQHPGKLLAVPDLTARVNVGDSWSPVQFGTGTRGTMFRIRVDGIIEMEFAETSEDVILQQGVVRIGESSRGDGHVRVVRGGTAASNVVSVDYTTRSRGRTRDFFVQLCRQHDSRLLTAGMDIESPEWTTAVSRTINTAELTFKPIGVKWFDDDHRYIDASETLAGLVGHFDLALCAKLDTAIADAKSERAVQKILEGVSSIYSQHFGANKRSICANPIVSRPMIRATLAARCGYRRIEQVVAKLIGIIEHEQRDPSTQSKCIYVLSRMGLTNPELHQVRGTAESVSLQRDVQNLAFLCSLPPSEGKSHQSSRFRCVWSDLMEVEVAALENSGEQSGNLIAKSANLPVPPFERLRLLSLILVSETTGKKWLLRAEQTKPFTTIDFIHAAELVVDDVKRGDPTFRWGRIHDVSLHLATDHTVSLPDRIQALRMVRQLGVDRESLGKTIRNMCVSSEANERLLGLQALSMSDLPRKKFFEIVIAASRSNDASLRTAAISNAAVALAVVTQGSEPQLVDLLQSGLDDEAADVRMHAIRSLVSMYRRSKNRYPLLVESAIKSLTAESSGTHLQLVAYLVWLSGERTRHWPPQRGSLPIGSFEDEVGWWQRNAKTVRQALGQGKSSI